MESLYLNNAVQTAPEVPQDVPAGFPTDGSATGGVSATVPGAVWYHGVTQEIVNAIAAAGITPSRNDLTQLAQAIRAIATAASPTGAVQFFAQATAPDGWLVCDGRAVSRAAYPELFDAIGETYGAGNGANTFNLPNLIGRFAEGATSNVGQEMLPGLPNITGTFSGLENAEPSTVSVFSGAFSSTNTKANGAGQRNDDDYIARFRASDSNPIYGRSTTVQPPAIKLLPCIKA